MEDKEKIMKITHIINKIGNIDMPIINKWVERSKDLIKHPNKFDYNTWCRGYLAADYVEYKIE